MSKLDEAKRLLHEELDELDERRQQIVAVLEGLGEKVKGKVSSSKSPGRPKGSGAKPKSTGAGGASKGGTQKEQIFTYLRSKPFAKAKEIGDAIGVKNTTVNTALSKARKDGEISTDASGKTTVLAGGGGSGAASKSGGKKAKSGKGRKRGKKAKSSKAGNKAGASGSTPPSGDGGSNAGEAGTAS